MTGHVEGDDAEAPADLGIVEEMAELPAVGAGGVQAQQRRAAARLLDEDAVRPAVDVDGGVAAEDGFELRHPALPSRA